MRATITPIGDTSTIDQVPVVRSAEPARPAVVIEIERFDQWIGQPSQGMFYPTSICAVGSSEIAPLTA